MKHNRRSIRLKGYDYSSAGAYFVTMCVQNRLCLFGDVVDGKMILNDAGRMVQTVWDDLLNHYENVELDESAIMPNHFHGIVVITNVGAIHVGAIHELPQQRLSRRKMVLPKLIGRFKMVTVKHINKMRMTPGTKLWQRNYYEHIIRNENELDRIREYIINNPLKWELDHENPWAKKEIREPEAEYGYDKVAWEAWV